MHEINELSVAPQHLILLLMFLEYKKVKSIADPKGKYGNLPKGLLSGGGGVTPLHPVVGTGLNKRGK